MYSIFSTRTNTYSLFKIKTDKMGDKRTGFYYLPEKDRSLGSDEAVRRFRSSQNEWEESREPVASQGGRAVNKGAQRTATPIRLYPTEERYRETATIESLLQKQGFRLKSCFTDLPDPETETLVRFIGKHKNIAAPLLDKIRQEYLSDKKQFQWVVKYEDHGDFLKKLHEHNLFAALDEFAESTGKKKTIQVSLAPDGEKRLFLHGGWLETLLACLAREVARDVGLTETEFECMQNVKVTDSTGAERELDIILRVADTLLYVEAKSGSFTNELEKYAETARRFNMCSGQTFLVASKINDNQQATIEKEYGLRAMTPADFAYRLMQTICGIYKNGSRAAANTNAAKVFATESA